MKTENEGRSTFAGVFDPGNGKIGTAFLEFRLPGSISPRRIQRFLFVVSRKFDFFSIHQRFFKVVFRLKLSEQAIFRMKQGDIHPTLFLRYMPYVKYAFLGFGKCRSPAAKGFFSRSLLRGKQGVDGYITTHVGIPAHHRDGALGTKTSMHGLILSRDCVPPRWAGSCAWKTPQHFCYVLKTARSIITFYYYRPLCDIIRPIFLPCAVCYDAATYISRKTQSATYNQQQQQQRRQQRNQHISRTPNASAESSPGDFSSTPHT